MALLLAATLLPSGCVRRRLAVRSNPPGALVFVDNQQVGFEILGQHPVLPGKGFVVPSQM